MEWQDQFNWRNGLWSLGLFALALGVVWYKLHLLRLEIHALVERLPQIGSEFIRNQMAELREELNTTRARVQICEERLGLNGEAD